MPHRQNKHDVERIQTAMDFWRQAVDVWLDTAWFVHPSPITQQLAPIADVQTTKKMKNDPVVIARPSPTVSSGLLLSASLPTSGAAAAPTTPTNPNKPDTSLP